MDHEIARASSAFLNLLCYVVNLYISIHFFAVVVKSKNIFPEFPFAFTLCVFFKDVRIECLSFIEKKNITTKILLQEI